MADRKTAAQKRKQTIIDRHYGGDEQAYIRAMRFRAAKGGQKSGGKTKGSFQFRSKKHLSVISRKGGVASGEVRRKAADAKEVHKKRPSTTPRAKDTKAYRGLV